MSKMAVRVSTPELSAVQNPRLRCSLADHRNHTQKWPSGIAKHCSSYAVQFVRFRDPKPDMKRPGDAVGELVTSVNDRLYDRQR